MTAFYTTKESDSWILVPLRNAVSFWCLGAPENPLGSELGGHKLWMENSMSGIKGTLVILMINK